MGTGHVPSAIVIMTVAMVPSGRMVPSAFNVAGTSRYRCSMFMEISCVTVAAVRGAGVNAVVAARRTYYLTRTRDEWIPYVRDHSRSRSPATELPPRSWSVT